MGIYRPESFHLFAHGNVFFLQFNSSLMFWSIFWRENSLRMVQPASSPWPQGWRNTPMTSCLSPRGTGASSASFRTVDMSWWSVLLSALQAGWVSGFVSTARDIVSTFKDCQEMSQTNKGVNANSKSESKKSPNEPDGRKSISDCQLFGVFVFFVLYLIFATYIGSWLVQVAGTG